MKSLRALLDELKKEKRNDTRVFGRGSNSDLFTKHVVDSMSTAIYVIHDNSKAPHIEKQIATHNCLINFVSGFESYFRRLVESGTKWDETGLNSLCTEKISIADAYALIKKGGVSLERIVAETNSFNQFEQIDSVMKKLLGCNSFWNDVESQTILTRINGQTINGSLKQNFPKWREEINSMYIQRNKYVHECKFSERSVESLMELFDIVRAVERYVKVLVDTRDES